MKSWTPIPKYLFILSLCLSIAPLFGLFNYLFLVNSQEFESIDQIVKNQLNTGALYYSAIRHVNYPYKLSLFKQTKPKIVAVGTSRVFQIRGDYFNVPFVNMGGTMQSLREGQQLFKDMVAIHKPEVIILGLDPWYFGSGKVYMAGDHDSTGNEFQMDMIFLPCDWLLKGKVSLPYYGQVLLGKNPGPFPTIGVFAGIYQEGFYQDGSFYALGRAVGLHKIADHRRFANTLDFINKGMGAFNYDQTVNQERMREFVSLVEFAQREKIRLIPFLTPLPGQILDIMAKMSDKYAYIDELKLKLPELCKSHYDFLDPRSFGSGDCEFIDGEHGGEIMYLRILQEIGRDPASGLSPYLNHARIAAGIEQYRGKTMVPPSFYKQPYAEPDFLGLGCKKN